MKLTITIDGKAYEVEVEVTEDDRQPASQGTYYGGASTPVTLPPAAPPPLGAAAPAGNFAEDKVCRSPIAGIVVRVIAQPGQQVDVNDALMVLEAMKMETNITSPAKAKIKSINASAGDGVQINQVLVEFE